jgi:hypothetical protein
MAHSQAWIAQGVYYHNDTSRHLQLLHHLGLCQLPCFFSRGPRVRGFLHPVCYGITGDGDKDCTKGSRQAFYVPTTVFDGDGLVITASHLAVYYHGQAAIYLAHGGCSTQSEYCYLSSRQSIPRKCLPPAVILQEVAPYCRYHYIQWMDDGMFGFCLCLCL